MGAYFGWTTWGWCDLPDGTARIYKHWTGQIVALPDDTPEPFILLSQMNDWIETEAGVEHEPTEAEKEQERANLIAWQTGRDVETTIAVLTAENAELRKRLGLPGAETTAPWVKAGS